MAVLRSLFIGIVSGTSILFAPSQISIALAQLAPQEISAIAKPITVRIDGTEEGSGVIIEKSGNTYTVLTNWHVVEASGEYAIQTYDGTKHQIKYSQIQKLSEELDLALIKFSSSSEYESAQIGDSEKIGEGETIYLAGYPANGQIVGESDRFYRFNSLNINAILPNRRDGGYSLAYGGENFSGMSGSPILNSNGDVIGINGLAYQDADGKARSNYAIPINIYTKLFNSDPNIIRNDKFNYFLKDTLNNDAWINTVAMNENKIISGDENNIKIWDIDTGILEKTLTGHSDEIWSVSIDRDKIISSSDDKTIKIWDLKTGELQKSLSHSAGVWSVAVNKNKLVSGGKDKAIKVWNLNTGVLEKTLTGHSGDVSSVAIAKGKIVSGSDDKTIKVWNLDTGVLEKTLTGHSDEVWSIVVNEDKIISGSKDKTVKVWNLNTGVLERTLIGHSGWIYSVAVEDERIVSSGMDKTVKVWNLDTGVLEKTLTGHSAEVWAVAINNQNIVSGGKDEKIEIWQLRK